MRKNHFGSCFFGQIRLGREKIGLNGLDQNNFRIWPRFNQKVETPPGIIYISLEYSFQVREKTKLGLKFPLFSQLLCIRTFNTPAHIVVEGSQPPPSPSQCDCFLKGLKVHDFEVFYLA